MKIIIYLLAFLFTFILIVGIHEMGHALLAHLFSVRIQRISLGFGRPLIKKISKSGIEWVWSIWPLGGYVQLLNSRIQSTSLKQVKHCFDKQPLWIRCIILIGGGIANFLLAWLALTGVFAHGYRLSPPIVKNVLIASPAELSKLKPGDRFLRLDQHTVHSWQETGMRFLMAVGEKQVPALVEDNQGNVREIYFNLSKWSFKKQPDSFLQGIGITPQLGKKYKETIPGVSLKAAFHQSFQRCFETLYFFLIIIKQLFIGILPFSVLLGPMGLVDISGQSFLHGLSPFLNFVAVLSLSVGLINLFPIPGLDGGSIIYAIFEKIRGRPISISTEILLYRLARILFFILFVQLALNDIQRYFNLI